MTMEMVLIEKIWMDLLETADIPCFIMDEHGQLIEGNQSMRQLVNCPDWQNIGQKNFYQQLALDEQTVQSIRTKLRQGSLAHYPLDVHSRGKDHAMCLTCREMQVQVYDASLYYGMLTDETEKKELKEIWTKAQKTVALGQLTGEIIHDFNNLNNIIQNCAELIHHELDDQTSIYGDLQAIRLAVQKAKQLSQKLLTFIHEENKSEPETFSVNRQIQDILAIVKRFMPHQFQIEYQLSAEHDCVHGDPVLLDQTLLNLLINAKEAMPHGGLIRISTKNTNIIKSLTEQKPLKIQPDQYICIQVKDTGSGIPRELKKSIFQPLFTTKPNGTGLGLSIVKENIRTLKGQITVASHDRQGTTFNLLLPYYQAG